MICDSQRALWDAYQSNPTDENRNRIVECHLPLVRSLAGKLWQKIPRHVVAFDKDDLYSSGCMGLLDSVRRFDPSRGVSFASFAARRVIGEMLDFIRRVDWVPRSVRGEIAGGDRSPESLTVIHHFGWFRDEYGQCELVDDVSSNAPPVGRSLEAAELMAELTAGFDARDREIVSRYYGDGQTMKQIAAAVGCSESRVSQRHSYMMKFALGRLKDKQSELYEAAAG